MSVKGLQPVERSTVAEAATAALFDAIVDGTLAPGTHLRLQDLAEQFGLSMMPVREALRRLAHMGLVELEPHRGAFVRSKTREDLLSTYETRILLEGAAVVAAVSNFTRAAESVARESLAELTQHLAHGDTRHARDAHERFHFALYEAAANQWLVRSILPVWRNAERYRLESMRDPDLATQRAREHQDILDAVLRSDGSAAQTALIAHLRASMDLVLETFGDSYPEALSPTPAAPVTPEE